MLRKYIFDPSHVIDLSSIEVKKGAKYIERPIRILDRKVKKLRTKEIPLVKVQWNHHNEDEATWEVES